MTPLIMLGFLATFLLHGRFVFFPVGLVRILLFFILWRSLFSDLANEVYDLGDSLLVKNRDVEVSIPLHNIASVTFSRPLRVTIKLSGPCELGDQVIFEPLLKWGGLGSRGQEIADDLERRSALVR